MTEYYIFIPEKHINWFHKQNWQWKWQINKIMPARNGLILMSYTANFLDYILALMEQLEEE